MRVVKKKRKSFLTSILKSNYAILETAVVVYAQPKEVPS